MLNQYRMAERQFGPIGVAGVYGVGEVQSSASSATASLRSRTHRLGQRSGADPQRRAGFAGPRRDSRRIAARRPARHALAIRPGARVPPLWGGSLFSGPGSGAGNGFAGGRDADHHSRSVGLPEAFFASARVFARKLVAPPARGHAVRRLRPRRAGPPAGQLGRPGRIDRTDDRIAPTSPKRKRVSSPLRSLTAGMEPRIARRGPAAMASQRISIIDSTEKNWTTDHGSLGWGIVASG